MTAVPVPLVMTALLARIARTVPLGTNTLSAMAAPFAKAATWTPRASSTVPFELLGMNDVMSVPRATTVRFATTVAQLVMTAALETIVTRVMTARLVTTVPPAAARISILRATRRRSTSPAKMSYSSVFRRWPLRPMTSMV
jgi:hypothetical protein